MAIVIKPTIFPSFSTTLIDLQTPGGIISFATMSGIALIDLISGSDSWDDARADLIMSLQHHGLTILNPTGFQCSSMIALSAVSQVTEDDSGWALDTVWFDRGLFSIRSSMAVKGGDKDTALHRISYNVQMFGNIIGKPINKDR